MPNTDNSLHALDDIFITNHRGRPVVCIGLRQTFYLDKGINLETRLRIGRCAEDYLQRYWGQYQEDPDPMRQVAQASQARHGGLHCFNK